MGAMVRPGTPALALHCALASRAAWAPVEAALAGMEQAPALEAIDLPGHGRAPDWDGQGDYHGALVAAARARLDTAPFLGAPADLIGHSLGATVALRLALETPARGRALILIEPVFFAAARAAAPDVYAAHLADSAAFGAAMAAGDRAGAAREFLREWGGTTPWEALPAPQRAYIERRMPLVAATEQALYHDSAGMLAPGRLEGLTCPVLLLEGSRSPAIVSAINAALAARLPNVRRARIEGAGHMLPQTHAPQVAGEIRRFLAPLSP